MPAAPSRHDLHPHPGRGAVPDCTVTVSVEPGVRTGEWHLVYLVAGNLPALVLPAPAGQPSARDGLWQHTCFEAFAGVTGSAQYREFNFSPSGDWAAYAFAGERVRESAAQALPAPVIHCVRTADTLRLSARLSPQALPGEGADLQIGLTAVLESQDGTLSYWALHHPATQPDFHLRAGWTARLPVL